MSFQISDASEIQFWPIGQESFNTKLEAYMQDACYHQKFLCTGLRRLQVLGGEDDDEDLRLSILVDGIEVETIDFTQTDNSTPGTPEIPAGPPTPAIPPETIPITLPPLEDGVNIEYDISSGPAVSWLLGPLPALFLSGSLDNNSYIWANEYAFIEGYTYNLTPDIDYDFDSDNTNGAIVFVVLDSNDTIVHTESFPFVGDVDGTFTDLITFVAGLDWVKYGFYCISDGIGGRTDEFQINSITATQTDIGTPEMPGTPAIPAIPATPATYFLNSVSFSPYDYSLCDKFLSFKVIQKALDPEDEIKLFYSDDIEFVSSWPNSINSGRVNIQFRSIQNFAGLIYDTESPYFTIDLDGQFVEPDFQTTEKVLELTEMVLNTASTFKERTLLVLQDMPRYMHRKVLLILQHAPSGSVIVNDIEISLDGGSYEMTKRSQNYILKPSQILLTHKHSYLHNVI